MLESVLTYVRARTGTATPEEGATAVEYGIMVALIAIVIIGAVFVLGGNLSDTFSEVADCIDNPSATGC
jgi:pilus assembly protein Flp/PilA